MTKIIFIFSALLCFSDVCSSELTNHTVTHHPVIKPHKTVQKNHTPVQKNHTDIKKIIHHSVEIPSKPMQKPVLKIENILPNYKKDEMTISTIYNYIKKDDWKKVKNYEMNNEMRNFTTMLQAAKIDCNKEIYDELKIYNFLSNKYPSVKATNLEGKLKSTKCSIEEEYILSAEKLLEQYRKNSSIMQNTTFQVKVREVWRKKKFFDINIEKKFANNFQSMFTQEDDKARLEKMLWKGEVESAERVFQKVDQKTRLKAKNRLELQKSENINQLFKNFKKLGRDENNKQILLFDAIKWCDKRNMQSEIYELLKLVPIDNRVHNDQWWDLIRPYIRDLLLTKDEQQYQLAYNLASHHGTSKDKIEYVEAEFLSGFVASIFIKNPRLALVHFRNSIRSAKQDFRKSRALYWLGLVNENLNSQDAKSNFEQAANYFTTFYGQLALKKLNKLETIKSKLTFLSKTDITTTIKNPIFKYYYYTLITHNSNLAKKVAKIITLSSRKKEDVVFLAKVANYLHMPDISSYIGNIAMHNLGFTVIEALYPSPNYKYAKSDKALNFSVIKRESNFEICSINDAGTRGMAHGLMQIIPAASMDISKELGIPHNHESLLDPQINVMYGDHFLNSLKNKWKGSTVLAIASYNAGAGSTGKWIKKLGDFRNNSDIQKRLIWLEQIPFHETRYYVQSVLSNMTIYQMLLDRKIDILME